LSSLKPIQERVLALIAAGFTATSAARQAGVHRHTVANWLHSQEFQAGLEEARATKQLLYWDQAEALAGKALANLCLLMDNPKVPPACASEPPSPRLNMPGLFYPLSREWCSRIPPSPRILKRALKRIRRTAPANSQTRTQPRVLPVPMAVLRTQGQECPKMSTRRRVSRPGLRQKMRQLEFVHFTLNGS
jgi:hypothetical protein